MLVFNIFLNLVENNLHMQLLYIETKRLPKYIKNKKNYQIFLFFENEIVLMLSAIIASTTNQSCANFCCKK